MPVNSRRKNLLCALVVGVLTLGPGLVPAQTQTSIVEVDRIVAVVNSEAITLRELNSRLESVKSQLRRQKTPLPPDDVFRRQILERLITDRVQLQLARETGLQVEDQQVDQSIQRIADGNRLTLVQLREALERDGLSYNRFREDIREEMTLGRLREREVTSKLQISDADVDHFLENLAQSAGPKEYELAHIVVRIPESASPEMIAQRRAKIEDARKRLASGQAFPEVAAAFSDAQDALAGGHIGRRPTEKIPNLYLDAVTKLAPGQISPILRSPAGFHLVLLIDETSGAGLPDQPITQTKARHILIRVNEVVSEADARHKLELLRERILHQSVRFEELAQLHSQDGASTRGGDLGWLYPSDTVPEFEQAMNRLQVGEISEPVRTPFGYHLIQVTERRTEGASKERQRQMARQALRDKRAEEAYEDWIRQIRDRAYVEIRIDE